MHHRPFAWVAALLILVGAAPFWIGSTRIGTADASPADDAAPATQSSERWYDLLRNGQKSGYFHVVWAPSTWKSPKTGESHKTIRDTTRMVTRESRDMGGMRDRFESSTLIEIERDLDGRLWWQRSRSQEASRVTENELVWTEPGYTLTRTLAGKTEVVQITAPEPVATDAEAFLGGVVRAGALTVGKSFVMNALDVAARRTNPEDVTFLGPGTWTDVEDKPVACLRFRQVHRQSGAETNLWIDASGTLVRLVTEGGVEIRRTSAERARKMPVRPAVYSITVPAMPQVERVFHADRLWVDIHLQADQVRKLPNFPSSPWSKVLAVTGDNKAGWTIKAELSSYPGTGVSKSLPLDPKGFERDLESTVLMPINDPRLTERAAQVIGDETDARKAAYKLSRYVYATLTKRSPDVAQASALQILDEECGDCSEHALLFVALCRAAGIPARRCSGFVCIGSMWGSHAWAEIWVGEWIGADPTTGEVGTGARYILFGYPERPGSYPGVVSSRALGRMRLVATKLREGTAEFDLTDRDALVRRSGDRVLGVLSGLEAHGIPDGWSVRVTRPTRLSVRAAGMVADVTAMADQGMRMDTRRGRAGAIETTFGGAPALHYDAWRGEVYEVFSRKRVIRINVRSGNPAAVAQLETMLRPTFRELPLPWKDDVGDAEPADEGDESSEK